MNKYLFIGLMFLLTLSKSDAAEDIIKLELNNLQGTWHMVRAEQDGKDIRERIGYNQIVVEGNATLVSSRGKIIKSQFTIDPAKKPKQITFITQTGDEVRGIYELKGDRWRQLLTSSDKERPKNFKDVGLFYEFERAKHK